MEELFKESFVTNSTQSNRTVQICTPCTVVTFESEDEFLKREHSNESYSTKQYFPVVLFIVLYK